MTKLGAVSKALFSKSLLFFCGSMGVAAFAQNATGKLVTDLQVTCDYKENTSRRSLSLSLEAPVAYRIRQSPFTLKVKTNLIESPELTDDSGHKAADSMYAGKGNKLTFTVYGVGTERSTYKLELPTKAIYPSAEKYDAKFSRSSFRDESVNKTYEMTCETASKVESFQFPYLSKESFKTVPLDVKWRLLASFVQTPTSDLEDYMGYEDEGAVHSQKDEEQWGRWLATMKVLKDTEIQALTGAEKDNYNKANEKMKSEVKDIIEMVAEEYETTVEEIENSDYTPSGEVFVLSNKQGQVIGYIVSILNNWASEEGEDDAGYDIYYDADFNKITEEEWTAA